MRMGKTTYRVFQYYSIIVIDHCPSKWQDTPLASWSTNMGYYLCSSITWQNMTSQWRWELAPEQPRDTFFRSPSSFLPLVVLNYSIFVHAQTSHTASWPCTACSFRSIFVGAIVCLLWFFQSGSVCLCVLCSSASLGLRDRLAAFAPLPWGVRWPGAFAPSWVLLSHFVSISEEGNENNRASLIPSPVRW